MDDAQLISRLAAHAGIETRYRDAWGEPREVPRDTVEALLASMGLPAASPALAMDVLRRIEGTRAEGLVEPAIVAPAESADTLVPLAAVPDRDAVFEWEVRTEAGERLAGYGRLAELAAASGDLPGRRLLRLPRLEMGYHALHLRLARREARTTLIIAPAECHLPEDLQPGARAWGLATQLYALRSAGNWGIGDLSDLARLAEGLAGRGARVLGVNPLHALFAAEPRHISPYSPSSRLFLNPLYIDIAAVPEFADCPALRDDLASPGWQAQLAAARQSELVDHAAVAALKQPALALLYRSFRARHLGGGERPSTARGEAFRAFQREHGAALRGFATFEALHELFLAAGNGFCWRDWPIGFQDPTSAETRAFAAADRERIEYFEYAQFLADEQLAEAARRGAAAGLSIGLYRDLAVGVDPLGADSWADQDLLVPGAGVGAPPDLLNLKGQDWGLAPVNPLALRRRAFAPFIAGLRANMRHAGTLRIDHVMGLQRLYWIPGGMPPSAGAYVAYPFADLLRILALESRRQRCAVIGEDLGTVPDGFRERMRAAQVLSYRVLTFERQADGSFTPPERYPALAAAVAATHDIASLRGYWTGRDLEWRRRLDLYPSDERRRADAADRARDRHLLLEALIREGVLPADQRERLLPADGPRFDAILIEAIHRFLARSDARLVLAQIEDATAEEEQVNLPGTVDQHPNWRRKLSLSLEDLLKEPFFARLAAAIDEDRARRRG